MSKPAAVKINNEVVDAPKLPCRRCGCTRRTISVNRSGRYATIGCTRCSNGHSVDFAEDCLRAFATPTDWLGWFSRLPLSV
jgi:hypothetical protein